jgi:hypothetical protein
LGSKADISAGSADVRFTPESGHAGCNWNVRFLPKATRDILSLNVDLPNAPAKQRPPKGC